MAARCQGPAALEAGADTRALTLTRRPPGPPTPAPGHEGARAQLRPAPELPRVRPLEEPVLRLVRAQEKVSSRTQVAANQCDARASSWFGRVAQASRRPKAASR